MGSISLKQDFNMTWVPHLREWQLEQQRAMGLLSHEWDFDQWTMPMGLAWDKI